tara:strand:+ start:330 stop:452 length:123 start_codon:yes stop_codon:yes gene_type:complete
MEEEMIWLLLFIILIGYIITNRKNILMGLKMLWEKIKDVK